MAYEVFVRTVRRVGSPTVSFQTSGRIALNAAATKILTGLAVDMVLLLWDASARKMAIRPVFKKDQKSYKLNRGGKGNGSSFSAVTFFEHVGFDMKVSRSFPAEWNNDQQMFEITLPDLRTTATETAETSEMKPLLAMGSAAKRVAR